MPRIFLLVAGGLLTLFYQPKLGFTLIVLLPTLYVVGQVSMVFMELLGFMGFDPSQMSWLEFSQFLFFLGLIMIGSCFSWAGLMIILISKAIGDESPVLVLAGVAGIGFLLCLMGLPVMLWNALTYTV